MGKPLGRRTADFGPCPKCGGRWRMVAYEAANLDRGLGRSRLRISCECGYVEYRKPLKEATDGEGPH